MKKLSIGSLFLILWLTLGGQQREVFKLIHSDNLYLNKTDTEQILELQGNVHFFYGKTEFKSDRALILDRQKIARLTGNVKVSNDTLSMKADSVAYYRNAEQLNLGGNVRIDERKPDGSHRWFLCRNANYDKLNDKLTTWGDVRAYDLLENAFASCGYAMWDRKIGYAYMIEDPRIRSGTTDTLYISAEKIEYFDAEEKIVATFNVEAKSRDFTATSDFLLYFVGEEKAVFTGVPQFKSDLATATAREFYLYFTERKLTRAELIDSCRVDFGIEEGQNQGNWVEAQFVKLRFEDQDLRDFVAEGNVSYFYIQNQTQERDYFQNQAKGDYLEAKISLDNKLEFMRMNRRIQGIYRFHSKS